MTAVLPAASAAPPAAGSLLAAFLRRHWLMLLVLGAATALRVLIQYAYWPAFWFATDSRKYLTAMSDIAPGGTGANGVGYPVLLRLLSVFDSLAAVAIVQHAAMLGLAVGIYLLLRRRGLAGWLATVATVPLLFDERQLVTEHYVLADALFILLLLGAFLVLLWRPEPGAGALAVVGALLVAAAVTRTVGVGVLVLVAAYLLLRRVGWRRIGGYLLTVLLIFGGYLVWNVAETGGAALSEKQGRFLFSRTAQVADCRILRLTPEQRALCPREPLDARPERGDAYVWLKPEYKRIPDSHDPVFGGFARAVITQQPADYLGLIGADLAKYLLPAQSFGPQTRCLASWSTFPPDLGERAPVCQPFTASSVGFDPEPASPRTDRQVPMQDFLHEYSQHVRVPPAALGGIVLLTVLALVCWPKRAGYRDALDAALLVGTGLALLVVSLATTLFSIRYGVPPLTLFAVGGALAAHRLAASRREPNQRPN